MRWVVLLCIAATACSSSSSDGPTVAADAGDATTTDSAASDAPAESAMETTSSCPLTGACFDDFLAKQTAAATCFGHFGIKCGTFNSAKTQCRWDDGAGFDLVPEDAGGISVAYKSATGTECFRRASDGTLTFPGGTTYSSKIMTVAGSSDDNTLTIGCMPSGEVTGTLVDWSKCGVDLRTCCN